MIHCIQDGTDHVRGSKKRSAKHYSKRHEQWLKKARASSSAASLAWLEDQDLTPVEVVVHSAETETLQHIHFNQEIVNSLGVTEGTIDEDGLDRVNMMLFVKDKYNVSGRATMRWPKYVNLCPVITRLKEDMS